MATQTSPGMGPSPTGMSGGGGMSGSGNTNMSMSGGSGSGNMSMNGGGGADMSMSMMPSLGDPAVLAHAGRQYFLACVIVSMLTTLIVILRIIARFITRASFGADDYMIIMSWVCLVGLNVNGASMFLNAFGDLVSQPMGFSSEVFGRAFYISQVMYGPTMILCKWSALAFFARIFTTRKFRIVVGVVAFICFAWFVAVLVVTVVQCHPVQKAWSWSVPGWCINQPQMLLAITSSNVVTDALVLLLPLKMVFKLKVDTKHRLLLAAIFLSGGSVVAASLARVISQAVPNSSILGLTLDCAMWTIIEPALAILSTCLPTLRPLLPKRNTFAKFSSFFSSGAFSNSKASGTSGSSQAPMNRSGHCNGGPNADRSSVAGQPGGPGSMASPFSRRNSMVDRLGRYGNTAGARGGRSSDEESYEHGYGAPGMTRLAAPEKAIRTTTTVTTDASPDPIPFDEIGRAHGDPHYAHTPYNPYVVNVYPHPYDYHTRHHHGDIDKY